MTHLSAMPRPMSTTTPSFSREEALEMALHMDLEQVLSLAEDVRQTNFGSQIELCAIINAKSGNCTMDCRFCSQSEKATTPIDTFAFMDTPALLKRVEELADTPVYKIGIVTSGSALSGDEFEQLNDLLLDLPTHLKGRLCGSLGRLAEPSLERLKQAGLSRFHHNMETSERFYRDICTTQTWESRLRTVKRAQGAGFTICSGGLFGMGETWEDRIDLAFRLREEGVDNIPINFLIAHPGTPLSDRPLLSPEEGLRIIAVFRHILPQATLRLCGGRPTVLKDRQRDMFRAGANALMTGNYLTTNGQTIQSDIALIQSLGLNIVHP